MAHLAAPGSSHDTASAARLARRLRARVVNQPRGSEPSPPWGPRPFSWKSSVYERKIVFDAPQIKRRCRPEARHGGNEAVALEYFLGSDEERRRPYPAGFLSCERTASLLVCSPLIVFYVAHLVECHKYEEVCNAVVPLHANIRMIIRLDKLAHNRRPNF